MARKGGTASFCDGLTRPTLRLLVRLYLVNGAPYGATVTGLVQYWRGRSTSWRALGAAGRRGSIEAALTQRFLTEGLCRVDGSLPHLMSQ